MNTYDKDPQAPQTRSTNKGRTPTNNTPGTPDVKENESHNSDPNKVQAPMTKGAPMDQSLDASNPQANMNNTIEPVADEVRSIAKA